MPQHPHRQTNAPSPRQGDTHQTSVWLSAEEVGWIDAQLLQMKQSGWRGVTRSAFIRALIRASMHHTAPVIGVSNEEELETPVAPPLARTMKRCRNRPPRRGAIPRFTATV